MTVITWNVKGLGNRSKRGRIKRDLRSIRARWITLQETKLSLVDGFIISQLCGRGNWGFSFSPSAEAAWGVVYCWAKSAFSAVEFVSDHRFVTVKSQWVDKLGTKGLICVYAPNERTKRVAIFDNMRSFINQWDCQTFMVCGVFNATLNSDERWGVNGFGSSSEEFVKYVEILEFQHLPFACLKFSFFEKRGRGVWQHSK